MVVSFYYLLISLTSLPAPKSEPEHTIYNIKILLVFRLYSIKIIDFEHTQVIRVLQTWAGYLTAIALHIIVEM